MSKLYTSRAKEQEATRRRPAHKSTETSFANDTEAGFESEAASPALYVFPALKIGRVDSPEERTADEVAHRVVGGGVVGPKGVERVRDGGLPVSPAIANRIQARSGQGEKLPEAERAFFEPRFGRGFGDVTIHRDGEAASLARSLNAKAFTVGSDIYFGSGQYSPSEDGRRLMAHELTHTVQQGAGVQREVEGSTSTNGSAVKADETSILKRMIREIGLADIQNRLNAILKLQGTSLMDLIPESILVDGVLIVPGNNLSLENKGSGITIQREVLQRKVSDCSPETLNAIGALAATLSALIGTAVLAAAPEPTAATKAAAAGAILGVISGFTWYLAAVRDLKSCEVGKGKDADTEMLKKLDDLERQNAEMKKQIDKLENLIKTQKK